MDTKNQISIVVWTSKIKTLTDNIHHLLQNIGYNKSEIKEDIICMDQPITLVFVGQYSAGKSTILKALTSIDDIKIGVGITTQETHFYDWNGIKVVDTPGIHTTLHPDHDDISYKAIANADMLVYVVTQELFDDYIGSNFRKLLLDKDKASEMILVVNKMADIGNTEENQATKLKDLEKVTKPYTPKQLRTVFIDAESYLDSLSETDYEIASELRNRSNYDMLVSTLNAFVKDKGLQSRLTTKLYKLYDVLQEIIIDYQPSTGDSDIDALEEHLLQERHIISNTQWRLETSVKSISQDAVSKIHDVGRDIANNLYTYDNENDANQSLKNSYNAVDKITSSCIDKITSKIEEISTDCNVQLDEFYKSDFSKSLKYRLESKHTVENSKIMQHLLKSDMFKQSSERIVANTIGVSPNANGLKAFAGSNVHKTVLNIGHVFGHDFEPWEAIKYTKKINIAGKILGAGAALLPILIQINDDKDAEKQQQDMRNNREQLRASFNDVANEVEQYLNNTLTNFLEKNYQSRIADIDSQVENIRNLRIGKSDTCKLLEDAQNNCKKLIADIHNNYRLTE